VRPRIARIAQFLASLFGNYFLAATLSTATEQHDLNFYYDLESYSQFDREAADQALTSVTPHLWYLTPELVTFSLCDKNV